MYIAGHTGFTAAALIKWKAELLKVPNASTESDKPATHKKKEHEEYIDSFYVQIC